MLHVAPPRSSHLGRCLAMWRWQLPTRPSSFPQNLETVGLFHRTKNAAKTRSTRSTKSLVLVVLVVLVVSTT